MLDSYSNKYNCLIWNRFPKFGHIHTYRAVMLLNMHKICIIEVINYSKIDVETDSILKKKLKIKCLVAWSISEGRLDQKQIINFVWPNISKSV